MTPELKRYWLKVLPFLTEPERSKLEALVQEDQPQPTLTLNERPPGTPPES